MVKESEVKYAQPAIFRLKPNLKTKGAILILVWNFLVINVTNYLAVYANRPNGHTIETVVLSFTLPLAGWLADVYLGRYKVIRWSMWIMWVGSMLATVSSVVAQFVDQSHSKIIEDLTVVLLVITTIGFGGYAGNIIQFGMDQLHDASTTEITAFISWLIWTYSSSSVIFQFIHMCMKKKYYHILGQLLVCISTAAVIASSFVLDTTLVKEPVTQNPFKLVYKVIRYAIKTKHPRCRSAFTYWEDELPSRIDFGKSKYGGPFTTEQVEDVKTFLRISIITVIACVIISEIHLTYGLRDRFIKEMFDVSTKSTKECYKEKFFTRAIGDCAITLLIPLHKFIIYPAIQRFIPSIKIYQKFLLGVAIKITSISILLVFDITAARRVYLEHHGNVSHCMFRNHQHELSSRFNSNWMAVTLVLDSLSQTLLYIGILEFHASQSPYSMRGLIFGAGYGSIYIFTMIGYGIYWPFAHRSINWGAGIISCEFWYLLSVLLVMIIFSALLFFAGRWYKNRKREDVLPSEHIFAERYYARLL
jgi:peptide/histidine transporter 3/4